MKFDTLTNRFIRGAAYSKNEESIFIIEANHSLYTLRALPGENAQIFEVKGAVNLEQAQFVTMQESPPVRHTKRLSVGESTWCTRRYLIYTSLGICEVTVSSDDTADADELRLELFEQTGYPPEDAKRLEDH